MKRILAFIPVMVLMILISSCGSKDNNVTPEPALTGKDKILVNYPWKVISITDLSGKEIAKNKWDATAQALPNMNFEFQTGNKVFARGIGDFQVVNGGTWYLTKENTVLDINITGFKGEFGVQELTNSKMKLTRKMPIDGTDQETVMVFEPVVK